MIRSATDTCALHAGLGLVFDLDGVIVDSNRVHSQSWREFLHRHRRAMPDDFDLRMFGRHNDEIVRLVFGSELEPAAVIQLGAEKETLYRERMGPVLREHLVPGLVDFLERHQGVPLAVATNAEPANVAFVLGEGGLRKYFREVIDGAQIGRPKPDPEIYLRAAERLGVRPVNCIVFEDSVTGVRAARAAGTRVVAIETTHSADELPRVDLSIRDFRDPALEPWLLEQRPG